MYIVRHIPIYFIGLCFIPQAVLLSAKFPGTVHVDDLYPQFGWPFMSDNTEAYNHAQANPSFNITDYSEMDRQFTSFFITLWTNFAKFGYVF